MKNTKKLKKNLGLFDVFAISTGAMFSSGFFLLPGLATAEAGPATFLSYLLAGLLMLPTLFSMAELSTAMPRAGGSYYFMDRSLGPLLGSIGGLGTWFALVFKSAFALIGMGAYLVIFIDLPMKPVAIGLTVAFTLLNVFGVKETTVVQRVLVASLIAILTGFIIAGLLQINQEGWSTVKQNQFEPFLPFGTTSAIYTAGLVFVSYAGLTKVASVAEEVQNPERNIPLGMLLSLGAATLLYVVGVFILTALLPAEELRSDLTPVATAASEVLGWLPGQAGLIIIVVAAIAAFASTANAGIMSASRYPLAMARDALVPLQFKNIGRFGTPAFSVMMTGVLMILVLLSFSEIGMAKLASAFQLLIFTILNLAVIIMRESRIPSYLPGFKSPLYPWLQILGMIFSIFLITNMGLVSVLFSLGVIVLGVLWFYLYAQKRVVREGAIYHIFERLGRDRHKGLEDEFRVILKEKGPIDPQSYEDMIARSQVVIIDQPSSFEQALKKGAEKLAAVLPLQHDEIVKHLLNEESLENTPAFSKIALPHFSDTEIEKPEIVLMYFHHKTAFKRPAHQQEEIPLEGAILLCGSTKEQSMHLRFLSQLANLTDESDFLERWHNAGSEAQVKECFLDRNHHILLELKKDKPASALSGKSAQVIEEEFDARILYIYRDGKIVQMEDEVVLKEDDRLTITGSSEAVRQLAKKYT